MTTKIQPWRCEHGHVMGQVVRTGRGIRQLILYRHALDEEADNNLEIDVISTIEGYAADIRCSVCGCVRTWVPGDEAMRHLMAQARRMHAIAEPA